VNDNPGAPRGATGARAYAVCVLVGMLSVIVLGGAQALAWAQVPMRVYYADALSLSTIGFWANAGGLLIAALGLLALDARRVSMGIFVIAAAFGVVALAPSPWIVAVAIGVAGSMAVQQGFFVGELRRIVALDEGRAQTVVGGAFAVGLAGAIGGMAWLVEQLGPRAFAVAALLLAASAAISLRLYRPRDGRRWTSLEDGPWSTLPARRARTTGRGFHRREPRTFWTRIHERPRADLRAVLASAASAGTVGAVLQGLPTVLEQAGYAGSGPLLLAVSTNSVAGLVMLAAWAPFCDRWRIQGLWPAAVLQVLGAVLLSIALWTDRAQFVAWEAAGLLTLNFARNAYNGSLFAVTLTRDVQQGPMLVVATAFGAGLAAELATQVTVRPGGLTSADVAVLFAVLCAAVTLAWPRAAEGRPGGRTQP
jgi:hypothetical protein